MGEGLLVAPLAAVTAQPPESQPAPALPVVLLALWALSTQRLTLTGSALLLRVSPVVLLALGTDTAPEARPALALPCHCVTGRVQGMCGVAATGLTAPWPPQAPEVGCAAITALTHDIGPAGTGSCATVTRAGAIGAVRGQCTPWVTATACRRVSGHVGLSP